MDEIAAGVIGKVRPRYAVQVPRPYPACSAFALLSFGWIATGVLSGSLTPFDLETRTLVHQLTSPTATTLMRLASTVGSAAFLMPLFVVAAAILLLSNSPTNVARLALVMTGATLIELTLKYSFHRPRPVPFFADAASPNYSFPSGHALVAFCFYGQLAVMLAGGAHTKRFRALIYAAAAALILAIGFSRIYLGVHYTSDVIAGYAAAAAWTSGLAGARQSQRRHLIVFRGPQSSRRNY